MKHQVNSSWVSYRNLGSVRVVQNGSGIIEQANHYYAFGGLLGTSFNGDKQKYKYNGKKLDRFLGWDMLDYWARWYDSKLQCWSTVDPLAEKYYHLSPYVYCADNPVKYVDPNGKEIWISYNDADGKEASFQYTVGMDYENLNSSIQTIVKNLNEMAQNADGLKVVSSIVESSTKYCYKQVETHMEGAEGYLYLNTICLNDPSNTLAFAEETFHVYQNVLGRGGATVVNEVEAKLFSAKMNYEIEGWDFMNFASTIGGIVDTPYEKNMNKLLFQGYDAKSFSNAVDNFFEGKLSGSMYKRKGYVIGDVNSVPLIKSFLPLKDN